MSYRDKLPPEDRKSREQFMIGAESEGNTSVVLPPNRPQNLHPGQSKTIDYQGGADYNNSVPGLPSYRG